MVDHPSHSHLQTILKIVDEKGNDFDEMVQVFERVLVVVVVVVADFLHQK